MYMLRIAGRPKFFVDTHAKKQFEIFFIKFFFFFLKIFSTGYHQARQLVH